MDDERADRTKAMGQLSADDPASGEPAARTRHVPVGVERVLVMAAADGGFEAALLEDRAAALRDRGLSLRASEQAMLCTVSDDQLRASIAGVDTSEGNLARRSFLRTVAAGAVTVASAEALSGCGDDGGDKPPGFDSGGIRPDVAPAGDGLPDAPGKDSAADTVAVDDGLPAPAGIRPGG